LHGTNDLSQTGTKALRHNRGTYWVGKKKRLSEHASELALPRKGGNPRFRAFDGLDDGTLGSTVTVKRQRSPQCCVAPTPRRPLSQKSGFCVVWMKRNFSLLLFQDDSSRGWSTVALAAMQDGLGYYRLCGYTGDQPPVSSFLGPLQDLTSSLLLRLPSTLAGVLYWGCQTSPLSGLSGATYRRRRQNCLPLNLT
jgi:hypothetical protein